MGVPQNRWLISRKIGWKIDDFGATIILGNPHIKVHKTGVEGFGQHCSHVHIVGIQASPPQAGVGKSTTGKAGLGD
jgi:hypothetical protein